MIAQKIDGEAILSRNVLLSEFLKSARLYKMSIT